MVHSLCHWQHTLRTSPLSGQVVATWYLPHLHHHRRHRQTHYHHSHQGFFSTKYTQQLGSSRLSRPLDPSGDFVLRSLQPLRPRDSSLLLHTRVPGCQHPFICLIGWSFASQLSSNIFNTENQSHWLVTKDSSHNQLPCPYCFSSLFFALPL